MNQDIPHTREEQLSEIFDKAKETGEWVARSSTDLAVEESDLDASIKGYVIQSFLSWHDSAIHDARVQVDKEKNNAYWERNQLVSALSKMWPSHLAKHPENDLEWERDWMNIVVINMPVVQHKYYGDVRNLPFGDEMETVYRQLTWHIHDSDLSNFSHLKYQDYTWDGHSTEEKYQRLALLTTHQEGHQ